MNMTQEMIIITPLGSKIDMELIWQLEHKS